MPIEQRLSFDVLIQQKNACFFFYDIINLQSFLKIKNKNYESKIKKLLL
jgi:hypothetical protein